MRAAWNVAARRARGGVGSSLIASALAFAAWGGGLTVAQAAPPPNTMPIWRLQVRFLTADVGDAGTDDSVKFELNGGNITWLDSGRDDRERKQAGGVTDVAAIGRDQPAHDRVGQPDQATLPEEMQQGPADRLDRNQPVHREEVHRRPL